MHAFTPHPLARGLALACAFTFGTLACGDDGTPMEAGTSSTGEMESSSSSSSSSTGEADETSSSSDDGSSSSSTGPDAPPAMGWGDCASFPEEVACLPEEVCVTYPSGSVCMRVECRSSFDCPPEIGSGLAPIVCGEVAPTEPGTECYYLCSGGQACPDGMTCDGEVCVWPGAAGSDSSGG